MPPKKAPISLPRKRITDWDALFETADLGYLKNTFMAVKRNAQSPQSGDAVKCVCGEVIKATTSVKSFCMFHVQKRPHYEHYLKARAACGYSIENCEPFEYSRYKYWRTYREKLNERMSAMAVAARETQLTASISDLIADHDYFHDKQSKKTFKSR